MGPLSAVGASVCARQEEESGREEAPGGSGQPWRRDGVLGLKVHGPLQVSLQRVDFVQLAAAGT